MKRINKILAMALAVGVIAVSGCSGNTAVQNGASTEKTTAERSGVDEKSDDSGKESDEEAEKAEAEAYIEALTDAFHNYSDVNKTFTENMEAKKYSDSMKDLDDMETALKGFEDIKAPEKYKVDQTILVNSFRSEYDFIDLCRKFIGFAEKEDSLTDEDKVEVKAITEEMELTSSDFADTFIDLVKKVKADIDK